MLPNVYELTKDNTNINELKAYRVLVALDIITKLLSVCLISLTVLFSNYYWFLVVGLFIISVIISFLDGSIAKQYKYLYQNDKIIISKISFDKNEKILFEDYIKNTKFTKKYATNTIITTKEEHAAIISNGQTSIMFAPDKYLIGLLEEGMRK